MMWRAASRGVQTTMTIRAGKKTNGLIASFAVIETTILRRKSVASENQLGIFKCQPTVGKSTVPLGLVKGDFHEDFVCTK